MNEHDENISVNDAKSLLDSIEQQKRMISEAARMPMWLNVSISVLLTWVISFDYFGARYDIGGMEFFIPFLLLFGGLYFWYQYLKKRGMKPRVFAWNKIIVTACLVGFLSARFFSDILSYLHESYHPLLSYLTMLCFAGAIGFLNEKYPLSEPISKGEKSGS